MDEQLLVPVTIMRGGTSKALFLKEQVLPGDKELTRRMVLALFGSPDKRQIDGLGGSDYLTSKCAVIGPPSIPEADVDYTFIQVSVENPVISYEVNCGNISSAAGVYAIEEGYVRPVEPMTQVRLHNTNTNKILNVHVPVKNGKPCVEGDLAIDGVPGTGAELKLDFSQTAGAATGQLLPTGHPKDRIFVPSLQKEIDISIVDVANICVYIHSEDVGMKGTEKPNEVPEDVLPVLEEIRQIASDMSGLPKTNYLLPFPVIVNRPSNYEVFSTGKLISESDVSFVARMIMDNVMHKAYAGTGSTCIAVASQIKGTVVHDVTRSEDQISPAAIRIGHPSGVLSIQVDVKQADEAWQVNQVFYSRTARRLMEGYAYIRKERLNHE